MNIRIETLKPEHIPGAVALQRNCFPAPFPEDLLWDEYHLKTHLELFPEGQFVALDGEKVVASASATRISDENWQAHRNWDQTVGGPFLETFDQNGPTLYGLDISVHPEYRGQGLGRRLYQTRFDLVRELNLDRYGTACRLPDYRSQFDGEPVEKYVDSVVEGSLNDRTLTPLLRYGLRYLAIIPNYMEDYESADSAALLEWKP